MAEKTSQVRALVIDDEAPIRQLMASILRNAGCVVEMAEDGREGLQALLLQEFDVVVVDLRMSGMDGIAFLEVALKMWPWMGIVVVTGHLTPEAREQTERFGVRSFVLKPFERQELVSRVMEEVRKGREHLARSVPFSLQHLESELRILRQLTTVAIRSGTLAEALRALSGGLAERFNAAAVGIFSIEDEKPSMVLYALKPVTVAYMGLLRDHMLERYRALSGHAMEGGVTVQTEGLTDRSDGQSAPSQCSTVPVVAGGEIHGLLTLGLEPGVAYAETDLLFLYHAANHVSTVLVAFRRIQHQALSDGLTGLYNVRGLRDAIRRIWAAARQEGESVGILVLDADHFKSLNDTYGHPVGDMILQELATLMREVASDRDVSARYGGDELVMIMPGADVDQARSRADDLIQRVRQHVFCRDTANLRVTVSVGVSAVTAQETLTLQSDRLMHRADRALYGAKKQGRDCVFALSGDGHTGSVSLQSLRREKNEADIAPLTVAVAQDVQSITDMLITILEAHEPGIRVHCENVRRMAVSLGRAMGMTQDELSDLAEGALLHDIGKLGIPDVVLNKSEAFTDEEWGIMRTHPQIGYAMLKPFRTLSGAAHVVLEHHERYDGSGYPFGLKGTDISLLARVFALADAYDAMCANRIYRKGMRRDEIVRQIVEGRGRQFDPEVVDIFQANLTRLWSQLQQTAMVIEALDEVDPDGDDSQSV